MGDSAPARNDLRLSRKVTEQNKRSGMAETAAFRDKTMETAENVHLTEEEIADLKEGTTSPPKHFTDVIHFESRQWKYSKCKGAG